MKQYRCSEEKYEGPLVVSVSLSNYYITKHYIRDASADSFTSGSKKSVCSGTFPMRNKSKFSEALP